MYINKNKIKKIIGVGLVLTSMVPSYSLAKENKAIVNPVNTTFNIYPDYVNDIIVGFYVKCRDNNYKYVNVNNINLDIDSNDMIFDLDDIDLDSIFGCNLIYNGNDVFIVYNNEVLKLLLFSNKVGSTNNRYSFDKKKLLKNIGGININYYNDEIIGFYCKKIDGSLGYCNVSGNYVNDKDKDILVSNINDIDLSSLVNCYIKNDNNLVYLEVPIIDGNVYRIYLDLIDSNYCLDNKVNNELRNVNCYYLDDYTYDCDYRSNLTGIYLDTISGGKKYVSVVNCVSNYKIDYSDIVTNGFIDKIVLKDKVVGIKIRRRDNKYDYIGVSPYFDYDYYNKENIINDYYSDNRDSLEVKGVYDYITSYSFKISVKNIKFLRNIVISFYGSYDYYDLVIYFNNLDRYITDEIYLPKKDDLVRYFNMYNSEYKFDNKIKIK